jgi:hypothetical protein
VKATHSIEKSKKKKDRDGWLNVKNASGQEKKHVLLGSNNDKKSKRNERRGKELDAELRIELAERGWT